MEIFIRGAKHVAARLRDDDGFSDLPVVVGLVTAAGVLGAALAGLDWQEAADALQTAVMDAIEAAGGGA
jgi:hypothetical protein